MFISLLNYASCYLFFNCVPLLIVYTVVLRQVLPLSWWSVRFFAIYEFEIINIFLSLMPLLIGVRKLMLICTCYKWRYFCTLYLHNLVLSFSLILWLEWFSIFRENIQLLLSLRKLICNNIVPVGKLTSSSTSITHCFFKFNAVILCYSCI